MTRSKTDRVAEQKGLERLLKQLRNDGIAVGLEEITRLQHAFSLQPRSDRDSLFNLLQCTLCKSVQQSRIFADAFDLWYEAAAEVLATSADQAPLGDDNTTRTHRANGIEAVPDTSNHAARRESKAIPEAEMRSTRIKQAIARVPWWFYFCLLLAFLIGIGYWAFSPGPQPAQIIIKNTPLPDDPVPIPIPDDKFAPSPEYWTWRPEIRVVPDLESQGQLRALIFLSLLALTAVLIAGLRFCARIVKPSPEMTSRRGPSWMPLLPRFKAAANLLSVPESSAAAWNIEKFISEELTRTLDLRRTVERTCRAGGIPNLQYQAAQYPREIWLWQDLEAEASTADKLITELSDAFFKFGLPVRQAHFCGAPDLIQWREGYSEAPLTLEGHRQQAWIFVFTDGLGVASALASALERSALEQLLRSLSQWPRLHFVDTAKGKYGLAGLLAKSAIDCIAPQEVARKLAGRGNPHAKVASPESTFDAKLSAWAAALCLSPNGADYATAMALRQAMKLEVPCWWIDRLHADAGNEGLIWPPRRRAQWLNWLAGAERFEIGATRNRGTALEGALEFWRKRYLREMTQREQAEATGRNAWTGSPAQARIRLELAFLDLWDQPQRAEETLSRLGLSFKNEIAQRLALYAPRDFYPDEIPEPCVVLPWRGNEIDPAKLARLLELGLAKDSKVTFKAPRMSASFGVAQGLLWGMIAIGAWQAFEVYLAPPRVVADDPVFETPAFRSRVIQDLNGPGNPPFSTKPAANLIIGAAKYLQSVHGESNQNFQVHWQNRWLQALNPEALGENQVWYAGKLAQPIRACNPEWPRRSLVVIEADPANPNAQKLAVALLDKGSADKVLIGFDWTRDLEKFIEIPLQATKKDQLILIAAKRTDTGATRGFQGSIAWVRTRQFPELKRALAFTGIKTAAEVWGGLAGLRIEGPDEIKIRGGPEKSLPAPTSPLTFIEVCGGTFNMGSETGNADEKPVHAVTLDTFWIAETEVTNSQYGEYKKDRAEHDEKPAVDINWKQAKEYCESYGYRLPTEAEWEYAARGGSLTDWSFGDDEKTLGDYAWYNGNSGNNAHPVKTKQPNPLGIYDLHGNVWEWVGDCHDEKFYEQQSKERLNLNPDNQSGECRYRGLRGGSAWSGAGYLRSAVRVGFNPGGRYQFVGFRCVRGPAASH